jgi:hypothetical protein
MMSLMICTAHKILVRFSNLKNEMGGTRRIYRVRSKYILVLLGTLEGRRLLGRPRYKWEDNNKMDLSIILEI